MANAPALAGTDDGRQNFLGQGDRVGHALQFFQAPIARATVLAVERLAKILDKEPMPASSAGRVSFHVSQQASCRIRQFTALLQHLAPACIVGTRVQQDTLGLQTVAAGPTRLLLVVFDRAGGARMDHVADV